MDTYFSQYQFITGERDISMSTEITMRAMLTAGVHFGHQTRYWNPRMRPYLFGKRNRIHIINLEYSLPMLSDAFNFVAREVASGKNILFVGTKRPAQEIVREQATRCGMPYVNRRWLCGLLTNFKTVRSSITRLRELEETQTDGTMAKVSKKEGIFLMRELEKLQSSLSGIKNMESLPDLLFVIDVNYEQIAVKEAQRLGIPVVAVVDSNSDPENIDYVIPGNDDAISSIRLYCEGMADAIVDARESLHKLSAENSDEYVELDADGNPVNMENFIAQKQTDATEDHNPVAQTETVDTVEQDIDAMSTADKEEITELAPAHFIDDIKKNEEND